MSENESLISGFCEVTGVSEEEATFYLESSEWSLQDALTTFFASERENAREESVSPTMADSDNEADAPAPAPKPTSIPKSKPRIATLSSLKKESSSEDEEGQHFYAGGSVHSGQEVVGPNKPRDMISDMFRSVRDLGATEASTSQSKPKTFKGTGYRLGQTSDDTEVLPGPTETRRREVVLRLWVNGFSVDDGPLRLYTNPENRKFLDKIKFGQVPEELIQDGNETVDLSMEDHRHEEFKAPKSVARVFSGTGNILGSLAPKVTASEPQPQPTEPGPPVEVDRSQPITAIQIRLDDGSRIRAELNHTHTIADLRNFLTNARPDYRGIPFSLLSTYPSKELDDDTITIAQAGILNASILLRKNKIYTMPGILAEGSLVWAAARGLDNEARHILEYGLHSGPLPGINVQDGSGRTAVSHFAGSGTLDLLDVLLEIPKVDFNLADNEGNTPLHFAAQAGQVEVVSLLLDRVQEIEVDARNNLGFTPLMKAAIQGRTKCAKLLLFAGASPTVRDYGRGLRAEEWARFCGRYSCAEMIERHSRSKLLEKGTSSGRWGSDPSLGPQVIGGVLFPPTSMPPASTGGGLASKIKKVLRPKTQSYNLVTHITSAAFCASSPALPAPAKVPPVVKSLIRPLTVPKLHITSPNEIHSYKELKHNK